MWCITQTSNETFAGLAQSVEQLTCNQQVEGSIPLAGFKKTKYIERCALFLANGEMAEWLKATDCKSVDYVYRGSNPFLPKSLKQDSFFLLFSNYVRRKNGSL